MTTAHDEYDRYYAEKLWEWIPEVYRHEDGLAPSPGVLRSLIELVGFAAATSRRSVDRLWEDQFAEFADDWALPYIGDLVATRLVNALNRRGRRADVANTIHYRRRKGTVTVIKRLAHDIADWDSVVVEALRRLARTTHRLDAPLAGAGASRPGGVTGTPAGGFADLRNVRGGDVLDGPFDDYGHGADVRVLRGAKGRYNIPKLNLHLFRQVAFKIELATPVDLGNSRFTFDPSGRDVQLFRPSAPLAPGEECAPADEWRVRAPLSCRLLGAASYRMKRSDIPPGLEPKLRGLIGWYVPNETLLRRILGLLLTPLEFDAAIHPILKTAITPDSPKLHLLPIDADSPNAVAVRVDPPPTILARERTVAANLATWDATLLAPATGTQLAVDPVRGRFLLTAPLAAGTKVFVPVHYVGLFGPLGASSYDRSASLATVGVTSFPAGQAPPVPGPITGFSLPVTGTHQFENSKTYEPTSPAGGTLVGVQQLVLQARSGARPYVRLSPQGGGARWTFAADPKPTGQDPNAPANRRTLVLDGLWLAIRPAALAAETVADEATPATPVVTTIVLDGVYDHVLIRHCTLDPGGEQARTVPTQAMPIPSVRLEIAGQVEELVIERSIVGPVVETTTSTDACSAGRIVIRDSIVQSIANGPAIATRVAEVRLERSTVFGDVFVDRLDASETLIQGLVQVVDNQHGCFRFSATNDDAATMLPRQFESHLFAPGIPNHVFVSRRFGDPGYAQLSPTAPHEILRGAENRSEMGVWSGLLSPIKRDDLTAKVQEFMPFGLIAQLIDES